MRLRTVSVAGIATAALVLSTFGGAATASGSDASGVSLRASDADIAAAPRATAGTSGPQAAAAKCKTGYGALTDPEDGIIAWNSTDGVFDDGGAADFTCGKKKKKRTIKSVAVWGYFGSSSGTDTFNVTFYANDPAGGSDEADDANVLCDYTLPGASGGPYPGGLETSFDLASSGPGSCVLPKANRHAWVRVQVLNAAGPWYWQVTADQTGAPADWRDVAGTFTGTCPVYNNDMYMSDPNCLGYTYPDWQLKLG